jgi:hypothetical protein
VNIFASGLPIHCELARALFFTAWGSPMLQSNFYHHGALPPFMSIYERSLPNMQTRRALDKLAAMPNFISVLNAVLPSTPFFLLFFSFFPISCR